MMGQSAQRVVKIQFLQNFLRGHSPIPSSADKLKRYYYSLNYQNIVFNGFQSDLFYIYTVSCETFNWINIKFFP